MVLQEDVEHETTNFLRQFKIFLILKKILIKFFFHINFNFESGKVIKKKEKAWLVI